MTGEKTTTTSVMQCSNLVRLIQWASSIEIVYPSVYNVSNVGAIWTDSLPFVVVASPAIV